MPRLPDHPVYCRCLDHPERRLPDGTLIRFSPDTWGNLYADVLDEDRAVVKPKRVLSFAELERSVCASEVLF